MTTSGFHPGSFRPVSGLGGVRAVSGLGCGCQQQKGMGTMAEVVKSPVFLLVAGIVLVGGYVVIRETVRWW